MTPPRKAKAGRAPRPYPANWEDVAELRVLTTTEQRWPQLIAWRAELTRKGWKLLQVSSETGTLLAVFGRTKDKLLHKDQGAS